MIRSFWHHMWLKCSDLFRSLQTSLMWALPLIVTIKILCPLAFFPHSLVYLISLQSIHHWRVFHSVSLIQFVPFADGCSFGNLTSPLTIGLRHFARGIDPIAAFWDFDLLDGHGGWWGEGCHIISSAGNITTIQSTHFSNFAVLMVSIWLSKYTYIFLSLSFAMHICSFYVHLFCSYLSVAHLLGFYNV